MLLHGSGLQRELAPSSNAALVRRVRLLGIVDVGRRWPFRDLLNIADLTHFLYMPDPTVAWAADSRWLFHAFRGTLLEGPLLVFSLLGVK